jgi:hypothetical protein
VEPKGKKGPCKKQKCKEKKKMFEPHMQKADRYRIGTDITPRILVNHHQRHTLLGLVIIWSYLHGRLVYIHGLLDLTHALKNFSIKYPRNLIGGGLNIG